MMRTITRAAVTAVLAAAIAVGVSASGQASHGTTPPHPNDLREYRNTSMGEIYHYMRIGTSNSNECMVQVGLPASKTAARRYYGVVKLRNPDRVWWLSGILTLQPGDSGFISLLEPGGPDLGDEEYFQITVDKRVNQQWVFEDSFNLDMFKHITGEQLVTFPYASQSWLGGCS